MKLPRSSLFFTGERERQRDGETHTERGTNRERERDAFPGVRVVLNCIALY